MEHTSGNSDLNLNSYVTFDNGHLTNYTTDNSGIGYTSGGYGCGGNTFDYPYWNNYIWPVYYPTYYPMYVNNPQPNKFEQAFKVVSRLLEKKVIEKMTMKQFIEAVNDIVTVL